jgi:hypothetical protein
MKRKKVIGTDRNVILKEARQVFFRAMLAGYAGDSTTEKTTDGHGYTTIRFNDRPFLVEDRYCVTPHSNQSAGTTTIFFNDDPIWWMSYNGRYAEEAIPFLKQALARACRRGKFIGGRGPYETVFSDGKYFYKYCNQSEPGRRQTFRWFQGEEVIVRYRKSDNQHKTLGTHRYQGRSLI